MVRAVQAAGFIVTAVPGACALITALVVSGLPSDKFIFEGFLPVKTQALKNYLSLFLNEHRTVIFYESVHRIEKSLSIFAEVLGEREAVVARELTKTFETIKHGTMPELCDWIKTDNQQKGEFVILLSGVKQVSEQTIELEKILDVLLKEVSLKQAVKIACQITGMGRKGVYAAALNRSPREA